MTNFNLTLGQVAAAWRALPESRTELRRFPGGKPLLVTGAYRSGTSWVGQMLASRGVWHLHEPFNPRHGVWAHYFSYRRSGEPDQHLDTIARGIKKGSLISGPGGVFLKDIRADNIVMPARLGLYSDSIRQVLVKDPIACLLSEYLAKNHDFAVLLVLRHPAGFASSLRKLGWDTAARIRELLSDRILVEDWLSPFEATLRAHANEPGLQAHTALYGALWTVLWGFAQRNDDFRVVNYERLCAAPHDEFKLLHQALNLPYESGDRARHTRLTRGRSSGEIRSPFDVVRNTKSNQRSWAERFSRREIAAVRAVWESFDIPLFRADDDWQPGGL